MPTLYLSDQYSIVRKDGDCLLVEPPKNGRAGAAQKARVPLTKVEDVVVLGNITLTAGAVRALMEQGVDVSFLSRGGRFLGRLSAGFTKNSQLRIAQFRAHLDDEARLEVARRFVTGKLSNMRAMLTRYRRRRGLEELDGPIRAIRRATREAEGAPTLGVLLGQEGTASAAYFDGFKLLLKGGWRFPGRHRRPPTDPVNALLSYGYTVLTGRAAAILQAVGFDPYVGFLHGPHYGRPALALDLVEEFRALVVDSTVLTCINTAALKPEDLEEEAGSWRLTRQAKAVFLARLEARLDEELTHPVFGYKVPYRRCMELQARLLGKWLTGEIPYYPPLTVR